jgi:hypothetical protein
MSTQRNIFTSLTDGAEFVDGVGDTFRVATLDNGGLMVRTARYGDGHGNDVSLGPLVVLSPEQVAELAALLSKMGVTA